MDFVIEDEQTQPAMMERDIVPPGIHRMSVKHCEEGPNKYKTSDENPDGQCIKLRLATVEGQYKFVFDDIPKHLGWRAKQLAESLAIMPVGGRLSLSPDELVGQVVNVEISHYTSKAGKVSAVVKRYVPASAVAAATPKPAMKPKPQKVAAAGPADDIPF
jgi:hypothetical protein